MILNEREGEDLRCQKSELPGLDVSALRSLREEVPPLFVGIIRAGVLSTVIPTGFVRKVDCLFKWFEVNGVVGPNHEVRLLREYGRVTGNEARTVRVNFHPTVVLMYTGKDAYPAIVNATGGGSCIKNTRIIGANSGEAIKMVDFLMANVASNETKVKVITFRLGTILVSRAMPPNFLRLYRVVLFLFTKGSVPTRVNNEESVAMGDKVKVTGGEGFLLDGRP